jgi:hypothetical protein
MTLFSVISDSQTDRRAPHIVPTPKTSAVYESGEERVPKEILSREQGQAVWALTRLQRPSPTNVPILRDAVYDNEDAFGPLECLSVGAEASCGARHLRRLGNCRKNCQLPQSRRVNSQGFFNEIWHCLNIYRYFYSLFSCAPVFRVTKLGDPVLVFRRFCLHLDSSPSLAPHVQCLTSLHRRRVRQTAQKNLSTMRPNPVPPTAGPVQLPQPFPPRKAKEHSPHSPIFRDDSVNSRNVRYSK